MKTDNKLYVDIGARIKERRKKLGLTQAQLCGDYMTRNMLSRIETGDANPSLETLLFIAHKLKIAPSYFLCRDAKEEAEYTKTVKIKDARRYLATGQYKKCTEVCHELPSDDDEVSAMEANAYIMLAIEHFDRGNLKDSEKLLQSATTSLHSTVYLYTEMLSQIKLLRALINSLVNGVPLMPSEIPSSLPVFFTRDRYFYILALALYTDNQSEFVSLSSAVEKEAYKDHITAIKHIKDNDPVAALPLLERAYANAPENYSAYFILSELEEAYKACNNYKNAYEIAEKRTALHDKYRSLIQD